MPIVVLLKFMDCVLGFQMRIYFNTLKIWAYLLTVVKQSVVRPLEFVFAKHKIVLKYRLCVKEKVNFK